MPGMPYFGRSFSPEVPAAEPNVPRQFPERKISRGLKASRRWSSEALQPPHALRSRASKTALVSFKSKDQAPHACASVIFHCRFDSSVLPVARPVGTCQKPGTGPGQGARHQAGSLWFHSHAWHRIVACCNLKLARGVDCQVAGRQADGILSRDSKCSPP